MIVPAKKMPAPLVTSKVESDERVVIKLMFGSDDEEPVCVFEMFEDQALLLARHIHDELETRDYDSDK